MKLSGHSLIWLERILTLKVTSRKASCDRVSQSHIVLLEARARELLGVARLAAEAKASGLCPSSEMAISHS